MSTSSESPYQDEQTEVTIADRINEAMDRIKVPHGDKLFKKFFFDKDNGLGGHPVGDSIVSYNHWVNSVLERQFKRILNQEFNIGNERFTFSVTNVEVEKSALTVPEAIERSANLSAKTICTLEVARILEQDGEEVVQPIKTWVESLFDIPVMVGSITETISHDPEVLARIEEGFQEESANLEEKYARIGAGMSLTGAAGSFVREGTEIVLVYRDQMRNNMPITQMEKRGSRSDIVCRYTSANTDMTRVVKLSRKLEFKQKAGVEQKENTNDFTRIYVTVDPFGHNTAYSNNEMLHVGTVLRYLADRCYYKTSYVAELIAYFAPSNYDIVYSLASTIVNGSDPDSWNVVFNNMTRRHGDMSEEQVMERVLVDMFSHIDMAVGDDVMVSEQNGEQYVVPYLYQYKLNTLCWVLARYLETLTRARPLTDLDNWANKRITGPSFKLQGFVTSALNGIRAKVQNVLNSKSLTPDNVGTAMQNAINSKLSDSITKNIFANMNPASSNDTHDDNYVERLEKDTQLRINSHLTRIKAPSNARGAAKIRYVRMEQTAYVCPFHTPENEKCGITKHKSIGCRTSRDFYYEYLNMHSLVAVLGDNFSANFSEYFDEDFFASDDRIPLCLNGIIIGHVPADYYYDLKEAKITGVLPFDTCVFLSEVIEIYTDSFRPVRPLLTVEDGQALIERDNAFDLSWPELLRQGYVEYVDVRESMGYVIAPRYTDIAYKGNLHERLVTTGRQAADTYSPRLRHEYAEQEAMRVTHAEIDPILMFGISAAHIPMANMSQGARILYHSSMFNQALSAETPSCRKCTASTSKYLANPVPPLFESMYEDILGITAPGTGQNVILAVDVAGGYNQEDSLVMNKQFIELGGFTYSSVKVVSHVKDQFERIGISEEMRPKILVSAGRRRIINPKYAALVEETETDIILHNYPMLGSVIREGDVILPIVRMDATTRTDASITANVDQVGRVEGIFFSKNSQGQDVINIKLREVRQPGAQDKFALRAAQKGTVARVEPPEDMQWDPVTHVRADAVINPHAMPTRMTMSILLEMMSGLASVTSGVKFDATTFGTVDFVELERLLMVHGFAPSGESRLVNGKTGEMLDAPIMMAPAYYQALQHHVVDKRKVRGVGQTDVLGQPKKSRKAKHGGAVRFGEMEEKAIMAHGASYVLKDRMNYCSDAYEAIYCKTCGRMGHVHYETGQAQCDYCSSRNVTVVTQSYGSNYFISLIQVLGIDTRLKVRPIEEISGDYDLLVSKKVQPELPRLDIDNELRRYQALVLRQINESGVDAIGIALDRLGVEYDEVVAHAMYEALADPAAELTTNVLPVRTSFEILRGVLIESGTKYVDTTSYEVMAALIEPMEGEQLESLVERFNEEVPALVDDVIAAITNLFNTPLDAIDLLVSYDLQYTPDGGASFTLTGPNEYSYEFTLSGARYESLKRALYTNSGKEDDGPLVALILRSAILASADPTGNAPIESGWFASLTDVFSLNMNLMASPLERQMSIDSYGSLFIDDVRIGSQGNAYGLDIATGSVLVYTPPAESVAVSAIEYIDAQVSKAESTNSPLRFVLLLPESLSYTEIGQNALTSAIDHPQRSMYLDVEVPVDGGVVPCTMVVIESPASRQISTLTDDYVIRSLSE